MRQQNKPLVVPKSKPRNPFGLVRKGTVKHKDKRKVIPDKLIETE